MPQKVAVYIIRYKAEDSSPLFLPESYDFKFAQKICEAMAKDGKRPVLIKVVVDVAELKLTGKVSRLPYAPCAS